MTAGQDFVKKIGTFGSVFFLLLFVLFLAYCFTAKPAPLAGYVSPHDSTYYGQSDVTLSELKTELETNVFPKLSGNESCWISDSKLIVAIDQDSFAATRSAILNYYDESLFEFTNPGLTNS